MRRVIRTLMVASVLSAAPAMADGIGVKVGVLTCNVDSGWGFVFGSSKNLQCTYANGPEAERYVGSISKFGVDIGYTAGSVIVWGVFAPTVNTAPGALSGEYAGATGSAAVVGGIGGNLLVGGLNRSITLQPLSIEGYTGLNVAAGIAVLSLHREG
jgi:hypothetical protein